MKYKAFISYRHLEPDRTVAVAVHRLLEKYTIPSRLRRNGERRLGRIFRDEDELPLSASLSESIQTALQESEYLIVICTPQFRESLWCMREVDTFIDLHGRDHVLCVLVTGKPEESFPPQLLKDENGQPCEPMAANLSSDRPSEIRTKLKREYLRLAAAMIGCDFDDLVQRAQRRKIRLLSMAAGVIVVTALGFASVLLVKNAQVTQALRLAQQNESEAVAGYAANLLRGGDRIGAMRQSADVLPGSKDPERPYVAASEEVLADALYVYHDERLFTQRALVDTVLLIDDIAVAKDGSMAFTASNPCVVKGFSPMGEKKWERTIMESKLLNPTTRIQCLNPDVLIASTAFVVCRIEQSTGNILWSEDGYSLLACSDGELLLKASGDKAEEVKPYRRLKPDGQVLMDFDPDPEGKYSFSKWAVDVHGQIVALGSPADGEDRLLLFIFEKETGGIRHVIDLNTSANGYGEDLTTNDLSVFLTEEMVLVFSNTIDWDSFDFLADTFTTLNEISAWRLDEGTQVWAWQTDNLPGTCEIWTDEEQQLIAVYSTGCDVISVLNMRDGRLVSEIGLSGTLCAASPYVSSAGNRCLRALLIDGTMLQINPADAFSWPFGGADLQINSADMSAQEEKIAAACTLVNDRQKLLLISRVSNPESRVLVQDFNTTAVAVSPQGNIVVVSQNAKDRNAADLHFLKADGTESENWFTVPGVSFTSLIGFSEDGKQVVFGTLGTYYPSEVLVGVEDGAVTRMDQNENVVRHVLSCPGDNIWNAEINMSTQTVRAIRNTEQLWEASLPERMSLPLTAGIGGCGWLAVYQPGTETGKVLLCDLESGLWNAVPDCVPQTEPAIACGNHLKVLAIADSKGLFLFNEQMKQMQCYPLPIERSAIEGISFSKDDQLLCLRLTGNRFCLLRTADGLCSEIMPVDSMFTEIWAEKTLLGDYAVSFRRFGQDTGYLIRADNLKIRARIPGLLAVVPGTRMILRNGEMPYISQLFLSPLYTLEELLEMKETRFR